MHKLVATLAVLLLVAGASAGVSADSNRLDGHRILLDAGAAARAGLAIRQDFANGRASAHVTDAQLTALSRRGIAFERIPIRSVEAPPAGKGKTGASARTLPPTQVPYGVKMIYGEPGLTTAEISGGQGIVVAVLDTGSVSHADFTRSDGTQVITGCVDFSQKRSPQVENTCKDGNGHGTHVTGTIAAAGGADGLGIFGVAPDASVYSYKVLSDRGTGYADDIARAIRLAADRGAQIINLSLGAASSSAIEQEAIRYAADKGVLVIGSAGNRGPEADTMSYPGALADVVAVAALNPDEVVASFSSRGISDGDDLLISEREVEAAAPGRLITSTYRDGGYYTMSGTSMAAPHIAGLAALRWQGSAGATRTWLNTAARDITAAEQINQAGPGYDIASGYGLPQVRSHSEADWTE